jgi:hypothetical protein
MQKEIYYHCRRRESAIGEIGGLQSLQGLKALE